VNATRRLIISGPVFQCGVAFDLGLDSSKTGIEVIVGVSYGVEGRK
jgi:hypothetical protein